MSPELMLLAGATLAQVAAALAAPPCVVAVDVAPVSGDVETMPAPAVGVETARPSKN